MSKNYASKCDTVTHFEFEVPNSVSTSVFLKIFLNNPEQYREVENNLKSYRLICI
jgi:hypothetical protein